MGGKLSVLGEAAGLFHEDSELGQDSASGSAVPSPFSATTQYLTIGKQKQMSVTGSIHGHSKRRTRAMLHFQSLRLGSNESWLLPVEWAAH